MSTFANSTIGTNERDPVTDALELAGSAARSAGATAASVLDWKRQARRDLGPRFFEHSAEGREALLRRIEPRPGDVGTRAAFQLLYAIAREI
jgi:hypothetical protein